MAKIIRFKDHTDIQKEGGVFCTANLADLHLTTKNWLKKDGIIKAFTQEMRNIDGERYDLITLSGDQGYGEYIATRKLARFLHRKKIPWAPTFGNHDYEKDTVERTKKIFRKKSTCLMPNGKEEKGDYYIRFVDEHNRPVRAFIFLDSGKGRITKGQVKWYEKVVKTLGMRVPTTLITHMPLPVFAESYREAVEEGKISESKIRGTKIARNTSVGIMETDNGLYEKIKRLKSTDTVLVGHDHKNNYMLKKDGITLIATQKTGYGGYFDRTVNGMTVLHFQKGSIDVYQLQLYLKF